MLQNKAHFIMINGIIHQKLKRSNRHTVTLSKHMKQKLTMMSWGWSPQHSGEAEAGRLLVPGQPGYIVRLCHKQIT
jgi:hypothetical protein